MRLKPDVTGPANTIRAYDEGYIRVNDQTIRRSVIVTPELLIADWPPQAFTDLQAAHLEQRVGCAEERSESFELFTSTHVKSSIATPGYRINATGHIVVKTRMRPIDNLPYPAMFYRIPMDVIDVFVEILLTS